MKTKILKTLLIPSLGISSIGVIAFTTTSCNSAKYLKIYANVDDSVVTFYKGAKEALTLPNLEYSTNKGKTWELAHEMQKWTLNKGETLYLKGNNPNGWSMYTGDSDNPNYTISGNISLEGGISISGSILSLIDNGGENKNITNIPDHCFSSLFKSIKDSESSDSASSDCSDIVSINGIFDKINSSRYSIGIQSFQDMFGNSNLSGGLNLNKLLPTKCKSYGKGAFANMFQHTNIDKVIMPNIPANVLTLKAKVSEESEEEDFVSYALYDKMFENCQNLFEVDLNADYSKIEDFKFLSDVFSGWLDGAGTNKKAEDGKCVLRLKYKHQSQDEIFGLPDNWEII